MNATASITITRTTTRAIQTKRRFGCSFRFGWVFASFVFAAQSFAMAATSLNAVGLRCEYLENPVGIDERQPRLTWRVESNERGQRQTAYQLLVASEEKTLKADSGDLWDSGKVGSEETVNVVYKGKP